MDVKKCFDRVRLDDVAYEAAQAGVRGSALKALYQINSDTVMTIAGDSSGQSFTAKNTVGQGLVSACVGAGLVMGKAVERQFLTKHDQLEVNGVVVKPRAFVDDVATPDHKPEAISETGVRLTSALDSICLEAHPTKSVRVTSGPAVPRRKMVEEMAKNPQKIQGSKGSKK